MGAVLDDLTFIENQDQIRIHHRLDPMAMMRLCDLPSGVRGGADVRFGFRIHTGGGVIQDQDAGILEERTGDSHALLLPAGEVTPRSPTRVS